MRSTPRLNLILLDTRPSWADLHLDVLVLFASPLLSSLSTFPLSYS